MSGSPDPKRLTCYSHVTGEDPNCDNKFDISGRVLLLWVWPVLGEDAGSVGSVDPIIFRDGSDSGDILFKFDYQSSGYGQNENAQSTGEGGILFPNGLFVDQGGSSTVQNFGGCTILYELG